MSEWKKYSDLMKELAVDVRDPSQFPEVHSRKEFILNNSQSAGKVLDVGAGSKWVGKLITSQLPNTQYMSMDIDTEQEHDFYSLDEVNTKFDVVYLIDVVEHLSLHQWKTYRESIETLLNTEGQLIISIPNVFYIGNTYFTNADHCQHYSYIDLFVDLRSSGYSNVKIYRLTEDVWKLSWKMPLRIIRHIIRRLVISSFPYSDYATDILIVASK